VFCREPNASAEEQPRTGLANMMYSQRCSCSVLRAFPFSATVLSRGVCGTAEMPVAPASTRAARFGCGAHAGPRGVLARAFVSPHASLPAALCRCEHHKQGAEKMLAVGCCASTKAFHISLGAVQATHMTEGLCVCREQQAGAHPWRQCAASVAAAALLWHPAPACATEVIQGPARAVDGDTLVVCVSGSLIA